MIIPASTPNINSVPIKTNNIIGIHNGNILFNELNFSNLEFSPKSDTRLFYEKLDNMYQDDPINFQSNLMKYIKTLNGEINIFFKLISVLGAKYLFPLLFISTSDI